MGLKDWGLSFNKFFLAHIWFLSLIRDLSTVGLPACTGDINFFTLWRYGVGQCVLLFYSCTELLWQGDLILHVGLWLPRDRVDLLCVSGGEGDGAFGVWSMVLLSISPWCKGWQQTTVSHKALSPSFQQSMLCTLGWSLKIFFKLLQRPMDIIVMFIKLFHRFKF